MIVVEEFRLELQTGKFKLPFPSDSEILSLRLVGSTPTLVVQVDKEEDAPDEEDQPEFVWLQGGSKLPEDVGVYEGSVERGGQLWHLFSVDSGY